MPTADVMAGQPYDVDVRVSDFNDLISVQYAVAWDSLVLEIDSLFNVSTSLEAFDRSSLSLPSETTRGTKGLVTMSWFFGAAGQTLPDDHLLFTMRFNQLGAECAETDIILTNPEQLAIEVIDGSFNEIGATGNTVPVMLPGAGCGTTGGNDVGLIFADATFEAGESVCIPLTVTNFTDIETFQGSFMWDPAVLSYTGLQNFGLTGLSAATFNVSMAANGTISFLWFDNTGTTPANLPDGGTAFEICFDVIGSDGDMTILKPFDGTVPIQISSPSPVGVRGTSVDDATINIGTVVVRDLFSIQAENVTVGSMQSEVCVDFEVENFEDIAGMQYTMQWDPNVLNYNRVETTDVEFASSFAPADNDKLRYVWTHSIGTGLSEPNGTVIYSVCFDIVADCDNTSDNSIVTPISFIGETSRPVEITDDSFTALDPNLVDLVNGSVTITCDPGCTETITNVRCFGESNGAINLDIFGGVGPYTVDWNPGPTQNGVTSNTLLVGQSAGTFTAMITTSDGTTFNCGPYTITQPNDLVLTVNVGMTSVTTNVTGGNGGETITYEPAFDPNNPVDGTYTATATDSRGCTDSQQFTFGEADCDISITNITIFSASCVMDGRILVTCTGAVGNHEIFSNPPLTFDANGEASAPAGTYEITCRDSEDPTCFVTETRTVLMGDPPALNANVTGTTPATCNQEDGMIMTSISGGCPPYTISVQNNGGGVEEAHSDNNKYPAGSYVVRFRDAGGNLVEVNAIVSSTSGPDLEISNVSVDASPCSGMNGQATFTLTGGCGATTCMVSINGGAPQVCNLTTNINGTLTGTFPVGNHTITFTDSETGSSDSESFSITPAPDGIMVMVNEAQVPNVDIEVSGGAGGYIYQWFFGGNVIGTNQDLSGLTEAGTYSVIIEDANGCTVSLDIEVTEVGDNTSLLVNPITTPFSGFATPCAEGDCSGTVTGLIQGDSSSAPFTITLTDSGANSTEYVFNDNGSFMIEDLCADSYIISVVDNTGFEFESMDPIIITAPTPIVISADPNDIQCPDDGQSNGSILAAVSGGAGNYILNWSPDALNDPFPTFMVENLGVGMYTLEVTDDNGCESEFTFDLLTTCTGAECFQGRRVITPNGDGANESLTITCAENSQISIFDRYSRLVFESSNYTNNWNGLDLDNVELPQGAYYWVLRTTNNTYKGTVTLLRD